MKHVKVFESFNTPKLMETEFSRRNRNSYNVELTDFPKEIERKGVGVSPEEANELEELGFNDKIAIEDYSVDLVRIEYDMGFYKDRSGVADLDFVMKSVRIVGTYEVWNEAKDDTDSFDFEIEDVGPFEGRVELETGTFPLYPEELEVSMYKSFDSANFRYRVKVGQ